eukprot:3911246-Rhodomonas_salina.7
MVLQYVPCDVRYRRSMWCYDMGYALSGTEVAYGTTRSITDKYAIPSQVTFAIVLRTCYAIPSIILRACYAIPSTAQYCPHVLCCATCLRLLRDAPY